jgi:hypothetical protein
VSKYFCFRNKNHSSVFLQHFCFVLSIPGLFGVEKAINPITGLHEKDHNSSLITQRNIQLYNRFRNRMEMDEYGKSSRHETEMKRIKESRKNLPIAEFR